MNVRAGLVLAALGTACGSAAREAGDATVVAPNAPADTPSGKCLTIANAQREKRPGEPGEINVRHVLVKHKGSKTPKDGVDRDRASACLRAMEVRDQLRSGAEFDAMVERFSDEPGAATRGGTLGVVRRSDVVPAFADAAFELDRGQLSDVVETEFGFHVILRVE